MVFQIPVKKRKLPELTIKINKNKINKANGLTVANKEEPQQLVQTIGVSARKIQLHILPSEFKKK